MSVASDILKHHQIFVDGVGFAGNSEEVQLPSLKFIEEDFRGGGMHASVGIIMGMEKLETSFVLPGSSREVMRRLGLPGTQITVRGSLESGNGTKTPVVVQMRGAIVGQESAAWKSGDKSTWTFSGSLTYYRYEQGGEVIHEIDVPNMVCIVNGVDLLADHRANIGL